MRETDSPIERSWLSKFGDAFRGAKRGVRGQSSFFVHFFAAAAVVAAAVALEASLLEWCVLLLCIAIVLTAEMFNSALESLAKAISREPDRQLGEALDIASAAVLVASLGAAAVGAAIFIHHLIPLVGG
ncbi:MAG: diacylglycerol kinase [Pirellulales bacterium]